MSRLSAEKLQLEEQLISFQQKCYKLQNEVRRLNPKRINQAIHRKNYSIRLWKSKYFQLKRQTRHDRMRKLEGKLMQVREVCKKHKQGKRRAADRSKVSIKRQKLMSEIDVREGNRASHK